MKAIQVEQSSSLLKMADFKNAGKMAGGGKKNQCAQAQEEENTNHKIQFAAKMIWSYLSDKTETVPIWTPFKELLFGIIKVFSTIGWKQLMRLLK